ncbi:MAG: stage II sporulation protein M [Sarcina ventriculi]|uniref:stage II sporulation protein M n=1 Tax=Sarcina ventriculi TaxID=1267 RepID=UPI00073E4E00|nr:stage II sporulation protein M [Sarcina ventriculi]MCI5636826.1 stage II sporulation protein M [Sarcina ventriculi]MDD7373175.1 stage II sporulation protein M [Sarcina ventriculi]MDY7063126.1 stage II sporulation protein M [Sarcina ventriculi]SPZ50304.1 stage II sporulation protein M [Sarcina ventriculi]
MKKLINSVYEVIDDSKIIFLWVLLFLLIGIVLGSCTVYYMSDFNKVEIGTYFSEFLSFLGTNKISYLQVLLRSIFNIAPIVLMIVLLGFTLIGCPVILFIDLVKGYILGFTFALLASILGGKGIILLALGIVIQQIIFIPCIIILSTVAVKNSIIKIKEGIGKERLKNSRINKNYMKVQSILSAILIIGIFIETYISPNLIKLVITK